MQVVSRNVLDILVLFSPEERNIFLHYWFWSFVALQCCNVALARGTDLAIRRKQTQISLKYHLQINGHWNLEEKKYEIKLYNLMFILRQSWHVQTNVVLRDIINARLSLVQYSIQAIYDIEDRHAVHGDGWLQPWRWFIHICAYATKFIGKQVWVFSPRCPYLCSCKVCSRRYMV